MANSKNIDNHLAETKERFASVLADASRAIVEEAMSPFSVPGRRIESHEVEHILEGINRGILSFKGNRIRFANDPNRICSLFALNREYFLQLSAFISLMIDYGYPADRCVFEDKLMDVCVYKDGKPWIYVETKAGLRESELLIEKIERHYGPDVEKLLDQPDRGNDPLRKAKQIHRFQSLEYFWLVTPIKEWAFKINRVSKDDGNAVGFSLVPVDRIPHYQNYKI